MTLTQPLKWHGGKHYLASKIVGLMPPHIHYVEPYFGGGSVLLAKDPEGVSEVVSDLNGSLMNFWEVLRSDFAFERFRRLCEATPFSEADYDMAVEYLASHAPQRACESGNSWTYAHAFFVVCRQSLAGRMKGFTGITKTRVRRGMSNEVSAWLTTIEGLPAVHERLKRVLILNRPALEVVQGQDGKDTLFYLDPPYLHETRATTGEYLHEMSEAEHGELLDLLSRIVGKFILSGYRSELYDDFASACGWTRRDFELPNQAAGGETKRRMTECLWMNF